MAVLMCEEYPWSELKKLHQIEPKNPDAQRLANWEKFARRKPDPEEIDGESYDEAKLAELESQFLTEDGLSIDIALDETIGKKGEAAFRRELKRFTSSTKPHHCLVKTINISAPSELLDEGVLLIDTPGTGG